MIREQDRTIDSIAGTLSTLAQQAGLMGQEIVEHNEYFFVCMLMNELCPTHLVPADCSTI